MAKVKLGIVRYTDSNGFEKPALVIGSRGSVQKGQTIVQRPDKQHANLLIFSPKTGQPYTRFNVPKATEDGQRRAWVTVDAAEAADVLANDELIPSF